MCRVTHRLEHHCLGGVIAVHTTVSSRLILEYTGQTESGADSFPDTKQTVPSQPLPRSLLSDFRPRFMPATARQVGVLMVLSLPLSKCIILTDLSTFHACSSTAFDLDPFEYTHIINNEHIKPPSIPDYISRERAAIVLRKVSCKLSYFLTQFL